MDETSMIERVARALAWADFVYSETPESITANGFTKETMYVEEKFYTFARAAVEAMRNADNDMLEAMHNAMFTSKFTGRELPMLGAGFEAAIDTTLSQAIGNKDSGD